MTQFDLDSFVDEFAESSYFQLLDPSVKEHAGGVITAFLKGCRQSETRPDGSFDQQTIEMILMTKMPLLDLPGAAKQGIPGLLAAFFKFLSETASYPPAVEWEKVVESLESRYVERFRPDGSVRGETFKKNYSDVSRNDPCPCGSGKKFKKCCMTLIG